MRSRIHSLICEIELLNNDIQNGCIDPLSLDGFVEDDPSMIMDMADTLLTDATGKLDDLLSMTKGETL